MDSNSNTDLLVENIKKELNSIINNGMQDNANTLEAKAMQYKPVKPVITEPQNNDMTNIAKQATFLDSQASQSIDENLQKMQIDLKQSYELFQNVGEKFESLNFACLKNRIKDLHLNMRSNEARENAAVENLKTMFQEKFLQNNMNKITSDMGKKFRQHPGEFGDIPELSIFFQACSQLEHGLEQLKRQRNEMNDLKKRMYWATDVSYDRIDEIRKTLNETNN